MSDEEESVDDISFDDEEEELSDVSFEDDDDDDFAPQVRTFPKVKIPSNEPQTPLTEAVFQLPSTSSKEPIKFFGEVESPVTNAVFSLPNTISNKIPLPYPDDYDEYSDEEYTDEEYEDEEYDSEPIGDLIPPKSNIPEKLISVKKKEEEKVPLKPSSKKPDEDEELPADLVGGPDKKDPKMSLKDPKAAAKPDPKAQAKPDPKAAPKPDPKKTVPAKPSSKKPDEDEELPADLVGGPDKKDPKMSLKDPKAAAKPDPKAQAKPDPKAAPKPDPKKAVPAKPSSKKPDEDEELPADLVGGPDKRDPKMSLKDPKLAAKPDPKAAAKPDPKAAAKPDPKAAAKPDPKKALPAKPSSKKPDEDEELPADLVGGPDKKDPKMSLKDPKAAAKPDPKAAAKPDPKKAVPAKPSSKKPDEDEELPADLVGGPDKKDPKMSLKDPKAAAKPDPKAAAKPDPKAAAKPDPKAAAKPDPKAAAKPDPKKAVPAKPSSKKPDEDEELPADLVGGPDKKDPKMSLKDPKAAAKPDPKAAAKPDPKAAAKPDPKAAAKPDPKAAAKPDPKKAVPAKPSSKKPDEDEELPADLVGGPDKKDPKMSLKDPKAAAKPDPKAAAKPDPKAAAKPDPKKAVPAKPSSKKPDEGEELPADLVGGPDKKDPKMSLKDPKAAAKPDPKAAAKPDPKKAVPAKPSSKKPDEDEELPADLVGGPDKKDPKMSLKDPKAAAKPDPKAAAKPDPKAAAKPDPKAQAKPDPKAAAKPDPKKAVPAKPSSKKPDEDEELPADLVGGPDKKDPKMSLKDPKAAAKPDPKAAAKPDPKKAVPAKPSSKKPDEDEELPADLVGGPDKKDPKMSLKDPKAAAKPDPKAAAKPDPKAAAKPDPKAAAKPDPKKALPAKPSSKKPDDDEEAPADLVGGPAKKDPKMSLKDPKGAAKPDPKVPAKPDPKAAAKPDPKAAAKPDPKKTVPAKPSSKKPDEDEELPADLIGGPDKKDPKMSLKDPKAAAKPDPKAAAKPDPKAAAKPDPKAAAKPDPKKAVPAKPSSKKPDDDEEAPADLVGGPAKKDPKMSLKDPKGAAKPDPKVPAKPDPKAAAKPDPKAAAKPDPKKTVPAKPSSKKPDEDEELPADLIGGPDKKDPKMSLKDPKAAAKPDPKAAAKPDPKAAAKPDPKKAVPAKPSSKKPDDDEEAPADLVGGPAKKDPKMSLKDPKATAKPDPKAAAKPDPKAAAKPDPKAAAKPDPKKTVPAKPSSKKPDDDEEAPADLVGGPAKIDPKMSLKDPKAAAKPDPKAQAKPDPKAPAKPDPKKAVPAKPSSKKPDDDEEAPADLVGGPAKKDPKMSLKDPKTPAKPDPKAVAKPDPKKTVPAKPSSKKPDDDEEAPADLVGGPAKKDPKMSLKDPKAAAKPDPKAQAKPDPKAVAKPDPKKAVPAKPSSKKPDDDEEAPADLVGGPAKKDPKMSLKDPKAPKPTAKNAPLKIKPLDDDVDVDATVPLKPKTKKPLKLKPDEDEDPSVDGSFRLPSSKIPADEEDEPCEDEDEPCEDEDEPCDDEDEPCDDEDEPCDDEDEPCEDEADEDEDIPEEKDKENPDVCADGTYTPHWVPPTKEPEEPIPMPPVQKSIAETNKEERIPPCIRYARKPRKTLVAIPFVIPWEQSAALITQEGMGAFGKPRNANVKVDMGSKELVQGALESETVIPMINDPRKCASRSGMQPFGANRLNISQVVDSHTYENNDNGASESIIPLLAKGSMIQQKDDFGNLRSQVTSIKYTNNMDPGMNKQSHGFISKQFESSKQTAGSNVLDRRRNLIPCNIEMSKESEGMIPLMFDGRSVMLKEGSEFGSFRPLMVEPAGGYSMTFDQEVKCKQIIPFQTAPSLST